MLNSSDIDIWIKPGSVLGRLETVSAVIPLQVNAKPPVVSAIKIDEAMDSQVGEDASNGDWLPDVDLSQLNKEQREIAEKMLKQECETFAKDANDIGTATGLNLKINLTDETPIHKTYNSIPKPLIK